MRKEATDCQRYRRNEHRKEDVPDSGQHHVAKDCSVKSQFYEADYGNKTSNCKANNLRQSKRERQAVHPQCHRKEVGAYDCKNVINYTNNALVFTLSTEQQLDWCKHSYSYRSLFARSKFASMKQ
nr:hypothetical protein [Enterovibrio nigricans]